MAKLRDSKYSKRVKDNVKKNIKIFMDCKRLSYVELSRRSGYTRQSLYKVVKKDGDLTVRGLARIAEGLGTTAGKLTDTDPKIFSKFMKEHRKRFDDFMREYFDDW